MLARKPTTATGFEEFLYEMRGAPKEIAQMLETDFFQKIDNNAKKPYSMLIENEYMSMTDQDKNHWVIFILTMMMRTPQYFDSYRDKSYGKFDQTVKTVLENFQNGNDNPELENIKKLIQENKEIISEYVTIQCFPQISQNISLGNKILRMLWTVMTVEDGTILISDKPILLKMPIEKTGGILAMPLTSNKVFFAVNDKETYARLEAIKLSRIVNIINKLISRRAEKLIVAKNDKLDSFIRINFGANIPN